MQPDFSKTALLRFLEFVQEKGLLTRQNAQNWRVATTKILDDLGPSEEEDVRKIDIDTAFRKFANRTAGKFNPLTLAEYRRRATLAIQNFIEYANDPASFRPIGQQSQGEKTRSAVKRTRQTQQPTAQGRSVQDGPLTAQVGAGLAMPYPLRVDFLAQLVIPRDMTTEEARRLSAFIMTLASDFHPEASS